MNQKLVRQLKPLKAMLCSSPAECRHMTTTPTQINPTPSQSSKTQLSHGKFPVKQMLILLDQFVDGFLCSGCYLIDQMSLSTELLDSITLLYFIKYLELHLWF